MRSTKKRKKGSARSSQLKDGRSTLTPTSSKSRAMNTRTSQTSTRKTSARLREHNRRAYSYFLSWLEERLKTENYKTAADELYWRYRARGAIIQNLLTIMKGAGLRISAKLMDPTLNIMRSGFHLTLTEEGTELDLKPTFDPTLTSGHGRPPTYLHMSGSPNIVGNYPGGDKPNLDTTKTTNRPRR